MATFAASSATWRRTPPFWQSAVAAAQGVDLRAPHLTSEKLQRVMREIRSRVPHYDIDHYLAPAIASMTEAVNAGVIAAHAPLAR
jgi:histidine ammonia-lyase